MQSTDLSNYYDLIEIIGIGNFSKVWLAKHKILDKLVAIKIIKLDKQFSKYKFINESQILAKVNSPNCVLIYDSQIIDSRNIQYGIIVTEHINGKTLNILNINNILWHDKLKLCYQLIDVVQKLHSINIIHNDLSANNIMITEDNLLKLIDFGSAKIYDPNFKRCASNISGTIDWSCPEYMINNNINDFGNDVYAMGSVIYFILTAKKPYDNISDIQEKITIKKNYMPTSLDTDGCYLPDKKICYYLKRMLSKRKHRLKDLNSILFHIKALLINEIFNHNIEKIKNDKS